MFQKIVNLIAVASGVVSLAVVGSGLYVYVQRDQLIDSVKSQVLKSVTGSLGGGLGGSLGGDLPTGSNDLAPGAPQSSGPSVGMGVPSL
tara:strand:+ start:122 stop:388 length:267 start_codon:yes stop_codon:yes gene_type:complete